MSLSRRYTNDGLPRPALGDSDFSDHEPAKDEVTYCDSCGEPIEGKPAGAGLFLWTRGDEIRFEEPPLCARCAPAIAYGATFQDDVPEE